MLDADGLFALLHTLNISYTRYDHVPVMTVADVDALTEKMTGTHCKNLFLKDKNKKLWLVTMPSAKKVDLKTLGEALHSKRLTFANEDLLHQTLGVLSGAVTPLGVVNDSEGHVTLVLDAELMRADVVNFHPLVNTCTVGILPDDLIRFAQHAEHPPVIIEL